MRYLFVIDIWLRLLLKRWKKWAFAFCLLLASYGFLLAVVERSYETETKCVGVIRDIQDVDLWVMDRRSVSLQVTHGLSEKLLSRLSKVSAIESSSFLNCHKMDIEEVGKVLLIGLDDTSLFNLPSELSLSDGVIIPEEIGVSKSNLMLQETKAKVLATRTETTSYEYHPVIFSNSKLFSKITDEAPSQDFLALKVKSGSDLKMVKRQVERLTNYRVLTTSEFSKMMKRGIYQSNLDIQKLIQDQRAMLVFLVFFTLGLMAYIHGICIREIRMLDEWGYSQSTKILLFLAQGLFFLVPLCILSMPIAFSYNVSWHHIFLVDMVSIATAIVLSFIYSLKTRRRLAK